MSTATIGSTRRGGTKDSDDRGSTVWFWLIVLAVLALTAFLVAWLGGWIRFTTDPRVAEIRALQQEARAQYVANGGPKTLIEATAAVAAMRWIEQKVEALPQHLRREVERSGDSMMRDAFRGRIDAYFAAPPEKRRAELDRQIDQEEFLRKAFETARTLTGGGGASGGSGNGGGGGAPGGGGGTRTGGGGARAGGGGPGGGGPGGGGPPRGGTEEDRNRWRKTMIDRTTPEERSRYSEYRRAMEQRRGERGLPSGGPR